MMPHRRVSAKTSQENIEQLFLKLNIYCPDVQLFQITSRLKTVLCPRVCFDPSHVDVRWQRSSRRQTQTLGKARSRRGPDVFLQLGGKVEGRSGSATPHRKQGEFGFLQGMSSELCKSDRWVGSQL